MASATARTLVQHGATLRRPLGANACSGPSHASYPRSAWLSQNATPQRRLFTTSLSLTKEKQVAFAFDIDGVLKMGEHVLPEAKRALAVLNGQNSRKTQIPYLFITNGGGPSEIERAKRLTNDFGTEVKSDQVIQAHTVLQSLTKRFGDKPVLILGGPGSARKVMNEYGFADVYTAYDVQAWHPASWPFSRPTARQEQDVRKADFSKIQFAAVLVFHDSRDWGRDLQYICDVLRSPTGTIGSLGNDTHEQVFLAFSHGDLVWGNDFPAARFGQGAFQTAVRAVYEQVSGRPLQATTFGKPQRLTYEYADALLKEKVARIQAERSDGMADKLDNAKDGQMSVWMIGDNPASDIAGANAFGWKSALVRTGVYRDATGPPAHSPTVIVDNVEDAVNMALEHEWKSGGKL